MDSEISSRRPRVIGSVVDMGRSRELVKNLSKRAAGRIGVGLGELLGSRTGPRVGILLYHRVAPRIRGAPRPSLNVTPERFREQLAGLLGRGFNAWPLSKVLDCHVRGMSVPPRTMVVTFDDGFETVYTNAWPVLRELKVPATVFISTAYLDSDAPFPFDAWGWRYRHLVPPETYRPLTTAQSREMTEDGLVELGSHTHTHEDFRSRPQEFRRDLQTSLTILQSRLGQRQLMFAFPFGRRHTGFSGNDLVVAAKQAGVVCGLTTESKLVNPGSDPFQWGRFNAYDFDTCSTLAAKLEGWYTWAPSLQGWLFRGGVNHGG